MTKHGRTGTPESEARTPAAASAPGKNGGPAHSGPAHDPSFFEDPSIAQTVAEDPLFRFLDLYWRQILVITLAVLAVFYAKKVFDETYQQSMSAAADLFGGMRREYENTIRLEGELRTVRAEPEQPDAKAEDKEKKQTKLKELEDQSKASRAKLDELTRALQDERDPYKTIGRLYQGLLSAKDGKLDQARESLGGINWEASGKAGSQERFFGELGALALARTLLDQKESESEGRSLLKSLGSKGAYVNVTAALALSQIAATPEQREEAAGILDAIVRTQPWQTDLVDRELRRLRG